MNCGYISVNTLNIHEDVIVIRWYKKGEIDNQSSKDMSAAVDLRHTNHGPVRKPTTLYEIISIYEMEFKVNTLNNYY